MRVGVCIPSSDRVHRRFMVALAALMRFTASDVQLSLFSAEQSLLPDARNNLARDALAAGVEWLFWLDSDMEFPPDALNRLLSMALHTGHKVIGCQYLRRVPPHAATGWPLQGGRVDSDTGLMEMQSLGFGCVLVHRDAFAFAFPWFRLEYGDDGKPVGEDVYFCRQVRGVLGWAIWCDAHLSAAIGHVGEAVVRIAPDQNILEVKP